MDIIKTAAEALTPISDEGVRIQAGWYDKDVNDLHVTLWMLSEYDGAHSDDGTEVDVATIQVNIWSKEDQQTLKKRIKKLMKKAGFYFTEGNDELEADTGIFMNAMRFLLMEEAEKEQEE